MNTDSKWWNSYYPPYDDWPIPSGIAMKLHLNEPVEVSLTDLFRIMVESDKFGNLPDSTATLEALEWCISVFMFYEEFYGEYIDE